MRVALLSTPIFTVPPKNYGGLELVVSELAKNLVLLGHDVTVFAPSGSYVKGCRMVDVGPPKTEDFSNFLSWFKHEKAMYEKIKGMLTPVNFDVVHGHNFFGFEYKAKEQYPALHVLHTHHTPLNCKFNYDFDLNFVAVSQWMRENYVRSGIGDCSVVYNGVDTDLFKFQERKGERFLWLSRVCLYKSPHVAIQVAKDAGVCLDVAGMTSFREDANYVEDVKRLCDGEQIRFIGEVSLEEKIKLMQNAKALLVTSCWGEPFGLHAVETLSCGTPVLGLRDGGLVETIQEGGVLVDDVDILTRVVANFERIRIGDLSPFGCRANAERFSSRRMAENYVFLYNYVLGKKNKPLFYNDDEHV